MFQNTDRVNLCQNSVSARLSGCQKWGFRKENCIFYFCLFYVGEREKKTKWKKQKTFQNIIFWGGPPKMREMFLTLLVSGREKHAYFRAHYCFGQSFWGPKQSKTGKTINSGFSGKCPLGTGEKVVFTHCVFEKLCSSENTIFMVFSAKHSSCSKNDVVWMFMWLVLCVW